MSKYTVTASEMQNAINELNSANNEFKSRVNELESEQQTLAGMWQGFQQRLPERQEPVGRFREFD